MAFNQQGELHDGGLKGELILVVKQRRAQV
jgi:hypothetical protein